MEQFRCFGDTPLSMWDNPIQVAEKTMKRFEYIGESEYIMKP